MGWVETSNQIGYRWVYIIIYIYNYIIIYIYNHIYNIHISRLKHNPWPQLRPSNKKSQLGLREMINHQPLPLQYVDYIYSDHCQNWRDGDGDAAADAAAAADDDDDDDDDDGFNIPTRIIRCRSQDVAPKASCWSWWVTPRRWQGSSWQIWCPRRSLFSSRSKRKFVGTSRRKGDNGNCPFWNLT